MARILICHVPKDGSIARDLGAALMGRGHFVSFDGEPDTPRPERASRLRQFEAVVVIWTEGSAQNPGLAEIARETLPLNLLVPVRAEELEKTRLPLMFRKLNMLAPRDVDGIARLVARLSMAASSLRDMAASPQDAAERARPRREPPPAPAGSGEGPPPRSAEHRPPAVPADRPAPPRQGPPPVPAHAPVVEAGAGVRARPLSDLPEAAADAIPPVLRPRPGHVPEPPPPRPAAPGAGQHPPRRERPTAAVITAADLARAVEAGLLVWHIPDAMWLGAPTTVEITLGRDILAGLIDAEVGHGAHAAADRQSIETLSLSLYGSAEAFEIERQSERTQFVSPKQALAGRDPATFGRWVWTVTPQAAGPQDLVVRISALLRDRHGVPAPVALPDRRFRIAVEVPEGAGLVSGLMGWYRR